MSSQRSQVAPAAPAASRRRPVAPLSRCGLYGVLSVSPLRVAGHQIANEVCIYQTQRDHPPESTGHVTCGRAQHCVT